MSGKVTIPDVGEVVITPTGRQLLAELLDTARRSGIFAKDRAHPSTRQVLQSQGLISWGRFPDSIVLTPAGLAAAKWLAPPDTRQAPHPPPRNDQGWSARQGEPT